MEWRSTPVGRGSGCREVRRDSVRPTGSGQEACPSASGRVECFVKTVEMHIGGLFMHQQVDVSCSSSLHLQI